jgi:hypothetical protein
MSQSTDPLWNNEKTPDFQKAELDLLRAALKRSYTERFLVMTTLMKRSLMLKKAKISHKFYKG